MRGDRFMDLMAFFMVSVPVIFLIVLVLAREKVTYIITAISGILFLAFTLIAFAIPEPISFPVPSLLWRVISLATVLFIFFRSVRDKQYMLSVLTSVQALIVIVFETAELPAEPDFFLYPDFREKLLLLLGAVVVLSFLPFVIYLLKKHYKNEPGKIKRFGIGFLLLLSSFAGLISARSMTGLFLFWQWQYVAGYIFLKVYGVSGEKNSFHRAFPYLQQAVLTLFLAAGVIAYKLTGSLAMRDFFHGFGNLSELLALIIFVSALSMGLLIPENYIPWLDPSRAVPAAGMYLAVFSLIVPYGVLSKFRTVFHNLNDSVISLMIIYSGILVFAGSYFALSNYRDRHSILNMIMSVSGLAVATVFKKLQSSIRFLSNNPLPMLMVIAGIVLTAAYIIMWISSMFANTDEASEVNGEDAVTSLIPFNINFSMIIKISYAATAALTLGVSLSCLK